MIDFKANVLLTGGEDANLLAWPCASLPDGENGIAIDGSSSSNPPVLAKRDHEGDVDMSDFSPENVSRCSLFSHSVIPGPSCGLTCGLDRKKRVTYDVQVLLGWTRTESGCKVHEDKEAVPTGVSVRIEN